VEAGPACSALVGDPKAVCTTLPPDRWRLLGGWGWCLLEERWRLVPPYRLPILPVPGWKEEAGGWGYYFLEAWSGWVTFVSGSIAQRRGETAVCYICLMLPCYLNGALCSAWR